MAPVEYQPEIDSIQSYSGCGKALRLKASFEVLIALRSQRNSMPASWISYSKNVENQKYQPVVSESSSTDRAFRLIQRRNVRFEYLLSGTVKQ